jgi:Domain of unknown function (DUF4253)
MPAMDDQILDRYQRAGLPVPDLRRARMTGGGLPVWTVHPLPPRREPFDSWRRLRAAHAQTGLWPFLVGPDRNEEDRQAHHVAVLRGWQERYGAELVTLARDHMELLVGRPPRDPATMVQVAVELLRYCPDLDVLGAGMVTVLANEVVPCRRWSLWWD